jgi:SPP1 family predicted phage head-tail adaptor
MRRTMSIGRLNKRITLYHFVEAQDSMGQSTQRLSEVATVWADIYPIRGSEFYELKKVQSRVTHKCFIRYHDAYVDINSNWYLRVDDKTFDIDSAIDVDYEHKMIEIRCYERVNKEEPVVATDEG